MSGPQVLHDYMTTLEKASNISPRFLQWEQPVEVSFPITPIQMSLAQEDLEKLPKDNEESQQRDGSLFSNQLFCFSV